MKTTFLKIFTTKKKHIFEKKVEKNTFLKISPEFGHRNRDFENDKNDSPMSSQFQFFARSFP
jgi:hypothetical protein